MQVKHFIMQPVSAVEYMWVKVFMERSQMLYASWLAEGIFYNIMLVHLQNA